MRRAVVLGVGNLLVSDDGVGIHVVRTLERIVQDSRVTFAELASANLDSLECLRGFDEAILIDAARSGTIPPGAVSIYPLVPAPLVHSPVSLHTIDLGTAFQVGIQLGMPLPSTITVIAVEAADTETFHEGCTDRVQHVLPEVIGEVLRQLKATIPDLRIVSPENEHAGCMSHDGRVDQKRFSHNITSRGSHA